MAWTLTEPHNTARTTAAQAAANAKTLQVVSDRIDQAVSELSEQGGLYTLEDLHDLDPTIITNSQHVEIIIVRVAADHPLVVLN